MNIQNATIIQKVCDVFQIGKALDTQLITDGFANESYFCTTDKGEFVVRLLKWQSKKAVENEVFIQSQLRDRGIPTTQLIPNTSGKYTVDVEGRTATVALRINGHHPGPIDGQLAMTIGRTLASFHEALKNVELPFQDKRWFNKDVVTLEILKSPESEYKTKATIYLQEALGLFEKNLPSGIIHEDFKQANILIGQNGEVYIFDFEEAEKNIFVFDLARTILEIAAVGGKIVDTNNVGATIDEKIVVAFLKGYNEVRQMTKDELENMKVALKYVTVAYYVWFINNGFSSFAYEYFSHVEQLEKSDVFEKTQKCLNIVI